MRTPFFTILLVTVPVIGFGAGDAIPAKDLDFFEKKVRPILVEHCYGCHSSEAKKIKGNLLLDTKAGWEIGGDLGPAVLPGKPDDSPLIQAVRYDDPSMEMPPKGALPNADIETLIEWVERGAPDPRTGGVVLDRKKIDQAELDAFRKEFPYTPLVAHPAPEPTTTDWAHNDIDRFLLARLEAESLAPNQDADPAVLVRRLSYDITGLPPDADTVAAFVADPSDAHLERLVDRWLASPQFGERWGRHWLDVARYADSSGGGRSKIFHEAWRYRDWVIGAFNQDLPYDEFMQQQIAGDLVGKTPDSLTATGFLLMAPTNFENQDKKALELDVVDEQIDVIGRAFMGMTIGCARCHDHKFDAITHDDYHALAGIFMSTKFIKHSNVSDPWKRSVKASSELQDKWAAYEEKLESINAELREARKLVATLSKGEDTAASADLEGIVVDDTSAEKIGFWKESTHVKGYIGEHYLHDDSKDRGKKRVVYTPELPASGKYEVRLSHTPSGNRPTAVPVDVHHAGGKTERRVNQRLAGKIQRTWTSLGVFEFSAKGSEKVVIRNDVDDGVVIADAVQFIPQQKPAAPEPESADTKAEKENAEKENAERLAKLKDAKDALAAIEAQKKTHESDKPPALPVVMAVTEGDRPEDMQERLRGVSNKLGDRIPRRMPSVVPLEGFEIEGSGRRQLADWLADTDNPFTARVAVNRLWSKVFGEGLVRTPDNFGRMGERPSHPELLDWLALRFMEDGWSVKTHLKLLFTSRAYRMDSGINTGHYLADAENRLLWRAHRKPLEAEALRDTLLHLAGRLDLTTGGTLVDPKLGNVQSFRHGKSDRRSVYQPVFRNNLPDIFEVFDFADSNQPIGRRSSSVLPTQALFLMNAPQVMELATATADRLGDSDVDTLFKSVLGRKPTPAEREKASEFLTHGGETAKSALVQALFASHDFRILH